jgi:hypothetical protein
MDGGPDFNIPENTLPVGMQKAGLEMWNYLANSSLQLSHLRYFSLG